MAYDSLGNLIWQEVGDATLRTWVDYHASGPLAGQLAGRAGTRDADRHPDHRCHRA